MNLAPVLYADLFRKMSDYARKIEYNAFGRHP